MTGIMTTLHGYNTYPYIIIAQESKLKITILDNIVEVTEKKF